MHQVIVESSLSTTSAYTQDAYAVVGSKNIVGSMYFPRSSLSLDNFASMICVDCGDAAMKQMVLDEAPGLMYSRDS